MTEKEIPGVIVLDDFFPNFDRVRQHAILSHYYDWVGPDSQLYKRISILHVPDMLDTLAQELGPIKFSAMGYRLNYQDETPNQSIHADLGYASHAIVVYLNEGESGTAFWQHKETGATEIWYGQSELFEQIHSDFENSDAWEQRLYVPAKQNRAVIYKSNLFHSRFPFKAFGDSPENGRLIAMGFFSFPEDEV